MSNSLEIGYRRVAGTIGLTNNESGTRGGWVEKRVALWAALMDRGYLVTPLSRFTKNTAAIVGANKPVARDVDILFLEFGGTNLRFNGKDWAETVGIVRAHQGRVFFICDDPDLPFLWDLLPDEDWSRWTILANAVNPDETRKVLRVPDKARVLDYPAHYGMPALEFSRETLESCVYLGRPDGRVKQLAPFLEQLVIAGKPSEWSKFPVEVIEQPTQSNRRNFYRQFSAAFAAFDNKHSVTGWRTGRAFHALFAGVPVVVPNSGNAGLSWAYDASQNSIRELVELPMLEREQIWNEQIAAVKAITPEWQEIEL